MDQGPVVLSDDLLQLCQVLRPCLGPLCKQYLLVTRTLNKVVATGSGRSVLRHTLKAHVETARSPLVRLAMSSVDKYEQAFGDGTTSLVLMIAEGLREAKKLTGGSAPQMLALSRGLSSVRSRWLDQVVVPYLTSQSLGVGEPSTRRPTSLSPGFKDSGGRRDGLKCTRRRADTLDPPRFTCDSHSQPPDHNSRGRSGASAHLQSAMNGRHGTAEWTPAGAGAADGQHRPVRRETPAGGNAGTAVGSYDQLDNGVDLEAYLERLRAVLGTAVEGLFSPQACNLIVELVVSWTASTAQQMHRQPLALQRALGVDVAGDRMRGGGGGGGRDSQEWEDPRRCLAGAARYIHRHRETLLLTAEGAGISESRIVDDGVVLPYGLIGAHPRRLEQPQLAGNACLRFVVLKCPVEVSSVPPGDGYHTAVTVGVTNPKQHAALLRDRGRMMQAVVNALTAAGVGLVVCTHALKPPFPDLLREAGIAGLQGVETRDADYLAQRFGARAFYRVRGERSFSDGADGVVGLARGVRRLSLGQGVQLSFCYIFGNGRFSRCDHFRARGAEGGSEVCCVEDEAEAQPLGLACQAVLRAPSNGILAEYASCVATCLTLALQWLTWDPPNGQAGSTPCCPESQASGPVFVSCPVVAGGGASELSLALLFGELAARCKNLDGSKETADGSDGAGGTYLGERPSIPPQEVDTELLTTLGAPIGTTFRGNGFDTAVRVALADGGGRSSVSAAFSVLAAALMVVPRVLLENSCPTSLSGQSTPSAKHHQGAKKAFPHFRLEHALKSLHARGHGSAGLVVRSRRDRATRGGAGLTNDGEHAYPRCATEVSLSCALQAGVVHPLTVKYGMLATLLHAMITSLRVGGVVKCQGRLRGGMCTGETSDDGDDSTGEDEQMDAPL